MGPPYSGVCLFTFMMAKNCSCDHTFFNDVSFVQGMDPTKMVHAKGGVAVVLWTRMLYQCMRLSQQPGIKKQKETKM